MLPCLLSVTTHLTQRWQHSSSSAIKRLLAPLSACLLVGFSAAVVLELLPPQLAGSGLAMALQRRPD
jgi:hypothetical protein